MNSALAFEIYRGVWLIHGSQDNFRNILKEARSAVADPSQKLNTCTLRDISANSTSSSPINNSSDKNQKIAVTSISGVITKGGGASSYGMQELSAEMIDADNDETVIGHLIKMDSPGGSKVAMDYMKATIKSLNKPKVTLVTRQGMAASAGYGILSEGDWVMAESADAEVGCHGVIWGASGVPNGQKDGNGEVSFVVISSTSPDKNKASEDAINKNDTSLMQEEVDKMHAAFMADSRSLRPNIKDKHLTGKMFPASKVVGTMIDAIGTEQDAVNKILELSKNNNTFSKKNSNAMTSSELLAQFPAVHAEIHNAGIVAGTKAGIASERERVKTWQVFAEIDQEAVNKGIAGESLPSTSEMAAFNLKAASGAKLEAIQRDSAGNIITPEAEGKGKEMTADEKEFKALYPKAEFKLN